MSTEDLQAVGVDLGGTKPEVAQVDAKRNLRQRRRPARFCRACRRGYKATRSRGGDNSGDAFSQERSKMMFYKDFIYNIFK
jgi:hypothetical protein